MQQNQRCPSGALTPRPPTDQAAFQFATAALWHQQNFSQREQNRAKALIAELLHGDSLEVFCERVLLANRMLQGLRSRFIARPSVWFHPGYVPGFIGTRTQHDGLLAEPVSIERQAIITTAAAYCQMIRAPSPVIVSRCRRELLALKAYGLLQIFYNAIIHLHYPY